MNFLQTSGWLSNLETYNQGGWPMIGFLLLIAWTLAWKGIALWKASRLGQKTWFIVMLVVNTVGILDIIYIFAVARRKEKAGMPIQM
jgi:hypothetical protein